MGGLSHKEKHCFVMHKDGMGDQFNKKTTLAKTLGLLTIIQNITIKTKHCVLGQWYVCLKLKELREDISIKRMTFSLRFLKYSLFYHFHIRLHKMCWISHVNISDLISWGKVVSGKVVHSEISVLKNEGTTASPQTTDTQQSNKVERIRGEEGALLISMPQHSEIQCSHDMCFYLTF